MLNDQRRSQGLFKMSNISDLPDDLLVKILSSIPTKDVVATCLLSKRWESLWTNVTRLEFVDKSLLSHQCPNLESLHFKLKSGYACREIGLWIRTAINRHIRELTIECGDILIHLPFRLLTCETLVILKLKGWFDLNIPLTASLPSLKTLHIVLLRESNYESFSKLLSNCPLLVDLMVEQRKSNAMSTLNITVPSLQRLFMRTVVEGESDLRYSSNEKHTPKVEINVPSLKYLNIDDNCNDFDVAKNLPQVVEASIKANETSTKAFLMSLTSSAKRLSLYSVKSEDMDLSFFYQLVHLELCTSANGWVKLLAHMLKCSLTLRVLKLFNEHSNWWMRPLDRWDPPSSVPECMMSSLETLEWREYLGRDIDVEILSYLLKHSSSLRTVKISSDESKSVEETHQMVDDLACVFIDSPNANLCSTYEVVF
ncbi:unnamed protein product [Thlaspi arvense]|uniref:F-box domain-containing protein n=1 Tax=Thlaspi arvense TaxID=13288 RepID=A0AAU9SSW6_THLAR|nr:unnamed protein product [Thlaspi arvense]